MLRSGQWLGELQALSIMAGQKTACSTGSVFTHTEDTAWACLESQVVGRGLVGHSMGQTQSTGMLV